MKLSSLLLAGVVVAGLSAMASPITKADGLLDPKITIGKGGGSPVTTSGGTDDNPVITTDENNGADFQYVGNPLSVFYVEVVPFSGEPLSQFQNEVFTCVPGGGATGCEAAPTCTAEVNPPCPSGPAVEFVFFAVDGEGNPVDFIQTGEHIVVYTPEPAAALLLLIGLVPVVAFGLKRRLPQLT